MTPKKVPLTTTMDEHMFEPSGEVEDYADLDEYEESEERIEEENIGMEKRPKMSTVTPPRNPLQKEWALNNTKASSLKLINCAYIYRIVFSKINDR